jgi:5-aminopentanamidase
MSEKTLRVAAAQCASVNGDIAANLKTMRRLAQQAAVQGVDVIVFPELFVSGYFAGGRLEQLATSCDGTTFQAVAALARELKLAICYGYPERDGAHIFNAAQLVDDQGLLLINHRKTHPFGDYERHWFTNGNKFTSLAQFRNFQFSVLICYEIEFPELARANAIGSTEVLLVPTAVMENTNPNQVAQLLAQARAAENNVFVVYANHLSLETQGKFNGNSLIAGPLGVTLNRASDTHEQLIVANLNSRSLAEANAILPYLTDLRHDIR